MSLRLGALHDALLNPGDADLAMPHADTPSELSVIDVCALRQAVNAALEALPRFDVNGVDHVNLFDVQVVVGHLLQFIPAPKSITGCCHFNENGWCLDHKGGRHVSTYCSVAHTAALSANSRS